MNIAIFCIDRFFLFEKKIKKKFKIERVVDLITIRRIKEKG